MEYTERMIIAEQNYKNLSTEELWNKLVEADQNILIYLFGKKYPQSKEASKVEINREKIFFKSLEDSLVLIKLLRKKPASEIYEIHEYFKSKLYAVKDEKGKKDIQSHLSFIEEELF